MTSDFDFNTLLEQMVAIPAGQITLRDDRMQRTWQVDIPAFRLAKYPVTQALYEAITHTNPSVFPGKDTPVENVSWEEAIAFCNLLSHQAGLSEYYVIQDTHEIICQPQANGFRLPTDGEWQYACQAGSTDIRFGELDAIGWYKGNSEAHTHPVGQKAPNAWGLYDMLGNVWEWCWDVYDKDVYGPYRVFRGGGWNDPERGCLATNRRRGHPTFRIDDLGFRVGMG